MFTVGTECVCVCVANKTNWRYEPDETGTIIVMMFGSGVSRMGRRQRVLVSEVSSSTSSSVYTLCSMANEVRTNLPAYRLRSLIIIFVNRPFILLSCCIRSLFLPHSTFSAPRRSLAQEVKITELNDVPIKVFFPSSSSLLCFCFGLLDLKRSAVLHGNIS